MKDDVTALLSSQAQQTSYTTNQQSFTLVSPQTTFNAFKNELINTTKVSFMPTTKGALCSSSSSNISVDIPFNKTTANSNVSNEFEHQIKFLEEQAKQLKNEKDELFMSSTQIKPYDYQPNLPLNNLLSDFNDLSNFNRNCLTTTIQLPFFNSNSMISSNLNRSNSNSLIDIRNEENYLKQVKEKLDLQLKETEYLKHELNRCKEPSTSFHLDDFHIRYPSIRTSSTLINPAGKDEVNELRLKLKESYLANEELKCAFKKNLSQLQNTLRECVDDKEKLILKRDKKIKDLEEECESLRNDLHQQLASKNQSEYFNNKIECYENLCNKLRQLILTEEKKREKSYFVDENPRQQLDDNYELVVQRLLKAITKCLDDYQGEIKHTKLIIKELQNSWESKQTQLEEKETNLNDNFNTKCETIKQEYDRIINNKSAELKSLQAQIDELNIQQNKQKEKYQKELDNKDLELKTVKLNFEHLKNELENNINDFKQTKTRFDTLKSKEKENTIHYEQNISNLERENEKLNHKCLDLTKEISDWTSKYDTTKCQLNKYEQLIDNLNEQVIILKRECKEIQLNQTQLTQNYESEHEIKTKLEIKCQELDQQLIDLKQVSIKHENCEKHLANLQTKYKQTQQALNNKTNEMTKLASQIEKQDALIKTQAQEMQQLNEQKSNFELQIKQLSIELNDTKIRFQNSTSLIQHSCKANTLLKEEKDSLEKILQDSAIKLKNLKTECDEVKEKHSKLEGQYSELQSEYDIKIKKLNEFQKLNEILSNEKEECIKESNQTKCELGTLQTNFKTLNRKLTQTITEKDNQISQLHQSLALYDKEINLLKQVEVLHKNQEDKKILEVANSIQFKLNQKKTKIDGLKTKLNEVETSLANLRKENAQLVEEKTLLETNLKNTLTKNESLQKDLKQIEQELTEFHRKTSHYEKALEKAALKYTNLEKRNQSMRSDLNKLKKLLNAILNLNPSLIKNNGLIDQPVSLRQSQPTLDNISSITTSVNSNLKVNTDLANKLIRLLATQMDNESGTNKNVSTNNNEINVNEVSLANFVNELRAKLNKTNLTKSNDESNNVNSNSSSNQNTNENSSSSSSDAQSIKSDQSNENEINIDSAMYQRQQINILLESSVEFEHTIETSNEDNQQDFQEVNKELCNNIETKLCQLNEIGLNLKKENHEVTQLLLQTGALTIKKS